MRQTIDGIERSDVLKALRGRLRTHPGRKSGLPLKALLVAMTVCLRDHHSARKNDYCAVLNGLDANDAHRLGLCDYRQRSIVSYHTVVKQSRRLEAALQETWVDNNGEIFDEPMVHAVADSSPRSWSSSRQNRRLGRWTRRLWKRGHQSPARIRKRVPCRTSGRVATVVPGGSAT